MSRALSGLIQATFGVKTTVRESVAGYQVPVTEDRIVPYNPNRLGLIMVNNGGATVYITPRNGAAVGRGIRLLPNGGTMVLKWDQDFELVASEWFGIADGAASDFYYVEVTAQ